MTTNIVIAFDAYGTLLSTESIAQELASHFGKEKAGTLAALWRRIQLEYTWRYNSMQQYVPFSEITRNSLSHALAESGLSLEKAAIEKLMKAYDSLATFPDVPPALEAIAKMNDINAVVFSNGTDSMVGNSVNSSQDLGPHASVFKDIITVEEVRCFKPHPNVYYHLAEKVGKSRNAMGEIWLVSGNPFDVVGARAVGMQACWVDRAGSGWTDELFQGFTGRPTVVVKSLGEVVDAVKKLQAEAK
ncbi:haloacid dehalogenase, type II [Physcia stellaris]|nr:haloacid dehalogenase, type II [Physcia stellaris]